MNFDDLRAGYTELWNSLKDRPEWKEKIEQAAQAVLKGKTEYSAVEKRTSVPWFVTGLIHHMEADGNFKTHLHNGDPLSDRTVNVPADRPKTGSPPFTWAESAVDAIRFDKLDQVPEWSLEQVAFQLEKYNGFRSRTEHHINSPYLWSGTEHYSKGKFVRDNVWDDNAVSKQVGCMPILRRLIDLDGAIETTLPAKTSGLAQADKDKQSDQDKTGALDLKELQRRLSIIPLYRDKVDGIYGANTRNAIQALLATLGVMDWAEWRSERLLIAGQQAICQLDGIDVGEIDGYNGPQTQWAVSVYEARQRGDTTFEKPRDADEDKPPLVEPPQKATVWPRQRDVASFFGEVGKHQTRLVFPYPMRLAWETSTVVTKTSCHEKVHDAAERVLNRVLSEYGIDKIRELRLDLFGGSLNVRKMRGGSAWSMHSWGIAFDFDPDRNSLKMNHTRAAFAKPEYKRWFELWEEEGAISLGRARDFDWMHVQFARL